MRKAEKEQKRNRAKRDGREKDKTKTKERQTGILKGERSKTERQEINEREKR